MSLKLNIKQPLHHFNLDIDVELAASSIVGLFGDSGSGKTSLLRAIAGLNEKSSGNIDFNDRQWQLNYGQLLNSSDNHNAQTPNIGMVFQGSALFDSMTIEENVMFPLQMFTKLSKSDMRERADIVLKRVNLPDAHKKMPSEASGGMQKRVAIARAIVNNPKYLFCDEPNSGLDPKTAIVIDNLIQEITEEYNITTVINSHDMNSVMEIGEKIKKHGC